MKVLSILFIALSIFVPVVMAQEPAFTVILNKGNNLHGVEKASESVILGETLQDNEQLSVAAGGYIALLSNASGMSLELNEAGTYSVSSLSEQLEASSNSVLSKYGEFLMSKLNPDGKGNQNLHVTGAVERGSDDFIDVYLPIITDVFGDELNIAWQQIDEVQEYELTIKSSRDKVLFRKNVVGTKYNLRFSNPAVADEKLLIINVRAPGKNMISKEYGINRISEDQKSQIIDDYQALSKIANTNNVIDKLLIASFFEENELLGDAISYYDQALALSPDAKGFERLYENFLYRNNLK
jgi:hypothetical protein